MQVGPDGIYHVRPVDELLGIDLMRQRFKKHVVPTAVLRQNSGAGHGRNVPVFLVFSHRVPLESVPTTPLR